MAAERLSPLDTSFLDVETPSAHMHVACEGPVRPLLRRARHARAGARPASARAIGRGSPVPPAARRSRPAGLGAPVWVDDEAFDLGRHVVARSADAEALPRPLFDRLADDVLSRPLDRRRALWAIHVAPRLDGGTVGIADEGPPRDGRRARRPSRWRCCCSTSRHAAVPEPTPAARGRRARRRPRAARTSTRSPTPACESLRALPGGARAWPRPGGGVAAGRHAAAQPRWPSARTCCARRPRRYLNVPIGPRRTLVGHHARRSSALLAVKRERAGARSTTSALAVVAGALRQLALPRGKTPHAAEGDGAGERALGRGDGRRSATASRS